jgi:MYXO-CTERM domain-containing protein
MTKAGASRRRVKWAVVAATVATAALGREARAAAIKIACIGEQTTHSHSFPTSGVGEYPWMLQMMLGAAYDTRNFGDCCATILQGYPKQPETHPYLAGSAFPLSVSFAPDIVVIGSWGKHDTEIANSLYGGVLDATKLRADYEQLVTTYLDLASKPKVYVSLPVPIPKGAPMGVTTNVILPAIRSVADAHGLPIVDLYAAFLNHPELYKDDTHVSDDAGLHKITDLVYAALTAGADAGTSRDAGSPTSDAAVDAGEPDAGGGAGASGAGGSGGAATGTGGSTSATGGTSTTSGAGGSAGAGVSGAAGAATGDHPSVDSDSGCAVAHGRQSGATWIAVAFAALFARRRRISASSRGA